MDENEQKQQLSVAYLHAVASAAGFACQEPGVDDDSVDRTLVARGWVHEQSFVRSPKIDVQLKCITVASTLQTLPRNREV
jgi:cytochrome oxidase assembly protein ShyY1